LGSKINSKNLIQEEIRLRIRAGNRSLFANKKLLKNKDLNAASKLQIYKTIVRPTVTYSCETWTMMVTEQNRPLAQKNIWTNTRQGWNMDDKNKLRTKTSRKKI
jgi:hypothetical protein